MLGKILQVITLPFRLYTTDLSAQLIVQSTRRRFLAESPPNAYKQSTLSRNTILGRDGNGDIYLFTAHLCSPFACGCVSEGRVKQIVTTLINGCALSALSPEP